RASICRVGRSIGGTKTSRLSRPAKGLAARRMTPPSTSQAGRDTIHSPPSEGASRTPEIRLLWAVRKGQAADTEGPTRRRKPSRTVPESSTTVHEPSTTVHEPSTTVPEPSTTVPEPSTTVPEPSTTVLSCLRPYLSRLRPYLSRLRPYLSR